MIADNVNRGERGEARGRRETARRPRRKETELGRKEGAGKEDDAEAKEFSCAHVSLRLPRIALIVFAIVPGVAPPPVIASFLLSFSSPHSFGRAALIAVSLPPVPPGRDPF